MTRYLNKVFPMTLTAWRGQFIFPHLMLLPLFTFLSAWNLQTIRVFSYSYNIKKRSVLLGFFFGSLSY